MIGLPEMEEFRKIVDEIYQELRVFDGEDTRFCVIIRGRRKGGGGWMGLGVPIIKTLCFYFV